MEIKDLTNNSSFIELSSDEAAKVNGGLGIAASALAQININRYGYTYLPGSDNRVRSYTLDDSFYDRWRYLR